MNFSLFPNFNKLLKKYPPTDRNRFVDALIERLGYEMRRNLIVDDKGKEKWTIEVTKESKVFFVDASQRFSLNKAVAYRRMIALKDYESSCK